MNEGQRRELVVHALPGYEPEIGRWLWALEETRRRTRETLEGLVSADLDRLPAQGHNSIANILYHIAAIELDWLHAEIQERGEEPIPPELQPFFPAEVRDSQGVLSALRGESLAQHLQRLDATRGAVLESLRGMSMAEFRRPRRLPDYDVTPEWVLIHLMQHEAEHRSEIALLRTAFETPA